jgi:hypothetical protein
MGRKLYWCTANYEDGYTEYVILLEALTKTEAEAVLKKRFKYYTLFTVTEVSQKNNTGILFAEGCMG